MDITLTVLHIHPTLQRDIDFNVMDDNQGKGPYIKWYNKEITQPTPEQLQTAWLEVEALQNAEASKKQKRVDILNIASITDQLNMLSREVYELRKDSTDPETLRSKKKYEDIQNILLNK